YCACVLVMLMAGKTHAGWMFEPYLRVFETFRNPANLLALGTLQDVRQLSHEEVKDRFGGTWLPDRPCFGLRVNVLEVLRGMPTAEPLEVPFAIIDVPEFPLGQGTDRQREACLKGRKALVLVNRTPASKEPSFSVWTVTSFEADEQVQFWRKVAALWNMPDVQDRRQGLLAGCRGSLPAFQDYCCNRLAIWDGGKPDDNAAEQLDRAAALPVIWERFVDPKTPLDVLVTCDEILGEMALRHGPAFLGWRTHPARYDVMDRALRRHSESNPPPHFRFFPRYEPNVWEGVLTALSHFPGRTRQTYRLFLDVIDAKTDSCWPQTLRHLRHLYRPHSADFEQQQLNRDICDRLAADLTTADRATSAAWAICDIARDCSYVGDVPARVATILDSDVDCLPPREAAYVRASFKQAREEMAKLRATAAAVERRRREGHAVLTIPTKSQVGHKVVFVTSGHRPTHEPPFGHQVLSYWSGSRGEPVWLEIRLATPTQSNLSGLDHVVVTGTLAERNDLPVFVFDPTQPWGTGLPVPPGYDVEDIRRRHVIVDVKWELVDSARALR
nr:hypothetical protein [Pirellulaceae bacterium]